MHLPLGDSAYGGAWAPRHVLTRSRAGLALAPLGPASCLESGLVQVRFRLRAERTPVEPGRLLVPDVSVGLRSSPGLPLLQT